ncbi:hypothetical protein J6590_068181 [Homalodisca vitripennis]|nr:hypothetical protein J6590_068181 [Homalodisca vitripennis]
MILTRTQSSALDMKIETVFEGTCDDGTFEGVIAQICSQLRAAQANYPDIDFTSLESVIGELLVKIDSSLSSLKTLETRFDHLQAENDYLSAMVQEGRCQRRLQLNDSLNAQEYILDEKESLVKNKSLLKDNISNLNNQLIRVTLDHSASMQSLVEKAALIVQLKKPIDNHKFGDRISFPEWYDYIRQGTLPFQSEKIETLVEHCSTNTLTIESSSQTESLKAGVPNLFYPRATL